MLFEQTVFLGGLAVRGRVPPIHNHEQFARPWSRAYFCATCGEVWGRTVVPDAPFVVYTVPCPAHPQSPYQVAGSILDPQDRTFNEALPPEIIRWEFQRHLAHYDRWPTHYQE